MTRAAGPRAKPCVARTPWWLVLAIAIASVAPTTRADIPFGPWTFDDRGFGDDAEQLQAGPLQLLCGATGVRDALVGFSPDRQLANIGNNGNANDFAIYFLDLRAVNEPGPDLVFFESAFSYEGFRIAVRPFGGSFSAFIDYPPEAFVDTGESRCMDSVILGLPLDIDDFGLSGDVAVDAIRFKALRCADSSWVEGDPVMAAVLVRGCPPAPDGDADGVGDACDCEPFGVRPGEPTDLRVSPDRRTFTYAPDPSVPGAVGRLLRGELTSLRATGSFDLVVADERPAADPLDDPTPPARGAPLYYLIATRDCEGSQSGLGHNSLGIERRP